MKENGIHYRWAGLSEGPVLVLAHSLGVSSEMWAPQVEVFGRRFRLLLYDHRGHGGSDLPAGPWRIDDFGRDLLGLLDGLGIASVRFCGLSMGGIVGLWLGQNAPERVERLALCNCAAAFENPAPLRARGEAVVAGGMAAVVEAVLERWFTEGFRRDRPEAVEEIRALLLRSSPEGYARTCEALCAVDLRPGLASLAVPSLAVSGRHDLSTPVEWTRAFAEAMPDCRLAELDSAHLSNLEAAEEFNRVVGEFLGG
jgi:3-oxoadipate enol-lactonase